ncbi:hypothetical protein E2C01_010665 [Portunus trituberculatus]|uniref:Uncharacterized protein n=1 Tax=Portunus trituberculatus TaxID=210409 RepID=A0A5B7D922_PORTR|nr:hypothetical protein [Portunus trituberculatus]
MSSREEHGGMRVWSCSEQPPAAHSIQCTNRKAHGQAATRKSRQWDRMEAVRVYVCVPAEGAYLRRRGGREVSHDLLARGLLAALRVLRM